MAQTFSADPINQEFKSYIYTEFYNEAFIL